MPGGFETICQLFAGPARDGFGKFFFAFKEEADCDIRIADIYCDYVHNSCPMARIYPYLFTLFFG